MKALARLSAPEGIAAMQSVNGVVLRSLFMGVFLGTAVTWMLALILSLSHWPDPPAVLSVVGTVLYLVGSVLVTIVFNVPKNEALASVVPADPDGPTHWTAYVATWTAWNHVRVLSSLAAAAAFTMSLAY